MSELTVESAPAGRKASSSTADWLELSWQTDWRDGISERQRSLELQQHDVIARLARRTAVLGVRHHFDYTNAFRIAVWLADIMRSHHDCTLV